MEGVNSGSSLVRFIEGHRFFGRPKKEKKQLLTCSDQAKLADYITRVSTCRTKAAGNCQTPDIGFTWTGDSCVCSILGAYASKFSTCIADTPYSSCYNAAGNNAAYASWSTDHCTTAKSTPRQVTSTSSNKSATPSTPVRVTTPTPSAPSPTTPKPEPKPVVSSDVVPKPPASSDQPKLPDGRSSPESPNRSTPGPIPSPSAQLSDKPEVKTDTVTVARQSTPSSAPELSLVTVVVASSTTPGSVEASVTPSASRIPLARWNGNGPILNGYCSTPEYAVIDGPTAYWAPVVGCMRSKSDCCPFDIASPTAGIGAAAVDTGVPALGANTGGASDINGGFPSAASPAQATLSKCPSDYHSVGDGCCPSNYFPWTTAFGGQTPCYSTLLSAVTPPPIGANIPSNPSKPTSAIVNVVYAMQYPLVPTEPVPVPKPSLATGAKVGIGAGAGVAALIFGLLTFLLMRKHRAHKKDKAALDQMSGLGSTRQSVASNSFGGVKAWQRKVASSEVSSGLEPVPEKEPTLPQVTVPQPQYPAEWRPGQRTVSPPVPHPGYYQRASRPSPPIPENEVYAEKVYSEMGSDSGFADSRATRSELSGEYEYQQRTVSPPVQGGWHEEVGNGSGRRSELSGEYEAPRQDIQGGYQNDGYHGGYGGGEWQQQGVAQQVRYYEAPAGRATPRFG